jgi:hypothetical protein
LFNCNKDYFENFLNAEKKFNENEKKYSKQPKYSRVVNHDDDDDTEESFCDICYKDEMGKLLSKKKDSSEKNEKIIKREDFTEKPIILHTQFNSSTITVYIKKDWVYEQFYGFLGLFVIMIDFDFLINALKKNLYDNETFNEDILSDLFKNHEFKFKNLEYKFIEKMNSDENTNKISGFQSNLTNDQIQKLFEQLRNDKYIDNNTLNNHFKAIFINEPLPNDFIPIKRLKKFKVVLLAYFVSEIFQKENPSDYWRIAEYCFNTKNLRQSLNNAHNYNSDNKPRGSKEIDHIIKTLSYPLQ